MTMKQVGVRLPANQGADYGSAMTVTNVAELKVALIEYNDENGRKVTTLGVIVGGKAFTWPNGEQLAASFKSFVSEINKQVLQKLEQRAPGTTGAQLVMDQSVDITPED